MEPGGKRKSVSPSAAGLQQPARKKRGGKGDHNVQHIGPVAPQVSHAPSVHVEDSGPNDFEAKQRNKFAGKLLNDILIVEICAGSARLTRVAREAGFHGLAIDHSSSRSCGIDICIFELEDQTQVDELCKFLEEEADNVAAVWIAPSCGTASRARERKLPQLRRFGIAEPIPLRSQSQPDQIDGLDGTNKLKVEKANMLYDAVEQIAQTACRAQIFTAIENPGNSHYWVTAPMQNLVREFGDKFVSFHNCCHGGERDKLTSVWVLTDWLDSLNARCDGSHPHKSWKVTVSGNTVSFPTADEAAYPFVLCERIIDCIKHKVLSYGAIQSNNLEQQLQQPDADAAGRIALGSLPRGAKVKPLVAEFGSFTAAVAPVQQSLCVEEFLKQQPKGSKITSRQLLTRGEIRVEGEGVSHHFLANSKELPDDAMVEMCWIGVPSDPDDFVQRALRAGHPRGLDVHVDAAMASVVKANLVDPPFCLAKKRVEFMKKWTARAQDLKLEEEKFREKMPEHVRNVLGNKRLVLFKEILDDLNYPDTKLIDDIASGFKLSGYMTKSNVFRARSKRPAFSLETLRKLSRSFNSRNVETLRKRQDAELGEQTWQETEEELRKGWIFIDDSEDLDNKFLGRRFGIHQGSKVRVIDDCTCCGLNLTVGLHEKFKLHAIDFLAAIMGHAFRTCAPGLMPAVKGRTYDLKSAYKQFAVSLGDRDTLRMGVNVPGQTAHAVIGFNSLPFGAVGSVAGFLRVSQALWYVGYFGMGLLWSAFYDDFTLLTRVELEQNSSWACESLFSLLGMRYATEGKKCLPFDGLFRTLGLEVDVSEFREGRAFVGHTESRKEEIGSQLKKVLSEGALSPKDAEKLRGRMIFFEGFTFGRVANSSTKSLGRFCGSSNKPKPLDAEMTRALEFLQQRISEGRPLKIERNLHSTWLVFTDGTCNQEELKGSVGGVLYDPSGACVGYFGEAVPTAIMDDLFKRSKNPIHELEVLPVLIAALAWGHLYACSQVVYYIDNESARMAYIRGTGETLRASLLVQSFVEDEAAQQHRVWFGRVPSHSNPADSPSRLDFSQVLAKGATLTNIDWEKVSRHLGL